MAVTRINHFEAKPGSEQALLTFLQSIVPLIQGSPGCVSARLLRGTVNAAAFAMIEEWQTADAHLQAVKAIPPHKFNEVTPLLKKPVTGTYFADVQQSRLQYS